MLTYTENILLQRVVGRINLPGMLIYWSKENERMCACFLSSWIQKWNRVRKKRTCAKDDAQVIAIPISWATCSPAFVTQSIVISSHDLSYCYCQGKLLTCVSWACFTCFHAIFCERILTPLLEQQHVLHHHDRQITLLHAEHGLCLGQNDVRVLKMYLQDDCGLLFCNGGFHIIVILMIMEGCSTRSGKKEQFSGQQKKGLLQGMRMKNKAAAEGIH